MYRLLTFLASISLLVASISTPAMAHVSGNSFEQVFKGYKVDVGYDQSPFVEEGQVRFDFDLLKEVDATPMAFSSVWVRVLKSDATIFAAGVRKPTLGKPGMTFTFPSAGEYILSVRFDSEQTTLVEASFPLTVDASADTAAKKIQDRNREVVIWTGLPLLGVAVVGNIYQFRKRRKQLTRAERRNN